MSIATQDRLLALLASSGLPHTLITHAAAAAARDVAAARGTPLEIGAKSIAMRLGTDRFGVLVVGSNRQIDGRLLRHALRVERYRFATVEELGRIAGLSPGEVPPFGPPLVDADLFVGRDFLARTEIAFAAASAERSIRMSLADWQALAKPAVVDCFTVPLAGEEVG